jgi:Flp pilus assembly protein TadB
VNGDERRDRRRAARRQRVPAVRVRERRYRERWMSWLGRLLWAATAAAALFVVLGLATENWLAASVDAVFCVIFLVLAYVVDNRRDRRRRY